jgi:hypothetical protein
VTRPLSPPRAAAILLPFAAVPAEGGIVQTDPGAASVFADIPERGTVDNLLRTAQQHHVMLSTMADTKANIIITVSSIVMTLALGHLDNPELRLSVLILSGFSLFALLLAILAVLPKYRPLRLQGEELPQHFNVLFFGHFAELSRERFLGEVSRRLGKDGSPYETWARDIYSLGVYLAHHKYRYLRYSYLFFLSGFVLACLTQGWRLVFA